MASSLPQARYFDGPAILHRINQPRGTDPKYSSQDDPPLPADGGLGRATSRRRRARTHDDAQAIDQPNILPSAPEVPRSSRGALPLFYRDPYFDNDVYPEQGPSSRSFAARAGMIPDTLTPQRTEPVTAEQPLAAEKRGSRRGSIKQTSYINYGDVKSPSALSYPTSEPTDAPNLERGSSSAKRQQRPPQLVPVSSITAEPDRSAQAPLSAPVRSATYKASPREPNEWAAERSPLQKLEVKLNDISKEEKRARVEQAEKRLRDAQAFSGARRSSQPMGVPIRQVSSSKRAVSGPLVDRRSTDGVTKESKGIGGDNRFPDRQGSGEQQLPSSSVARHDRPVYPIPTRSSSQRQPVQSQSSTDWGRRVEKTQGEDRGVRFHHEVQDMSSAGSPNHGSGNTCEGAATGAALPKSTRQQVLTGQEGGPDYSENLKEKALGPPDPVPGHAVRSHKDGLKYEVPPQTAAGIEARKQVGFGSRLDEKTDMPTHHRPHLSTILHYGRHDKATPGALKPPATRHLNEWRTGAIARLTLMDLQPNVGKSKLVKKKAWWENPQPSSKKQNQSEDYETEVDPDDGYIEGQNGMHNFPFRS